MPPPWGPRRPEFSAAAARNRSIEHPRKRAITLRQLRELREFVKRLCKTGLLRYPDCASGRQLGRVGQPVKWTEVTQHEINSEIIKKVIPRDFSCSWSELVADGRPQNRDFFCSHSWSEPFRDFMASIEHHARENNVGSEDAYWVCVFANDQWAVDLGWKLTDSPFYEALRGCPTTVLMLDRRFEVFRRMWVVFEMSQTTRLEQRLEIWTPIGRVGSPQVASGPMVKALDTLDTAAAYASCPCDQRQIMNHIAGVDEMRGLKQAAEGGKLLDPHVLDPPHYEKRLVEEHLEAFEDLNHSIREAARVVAQPRAARTTTLERQPSCIDPAMRGITLVQLRTLAQKVSEYFRGGSNEVCQDLDSPIFGQEVTDKTATWNHVYQHIIQPATSRISGACYMQLLTTGDQRPEYHVSFSMHATYRNFMAAVEWHAEARQLPDSTVYWIDALALGQRELGFDCSSTARRAQHEIPSRVIRDHAAGVVLYVDTRGDWAAKGWTTYQIHLAFEFGKTFDIIDKDGALATTRPFADTSWCFGNLGVNAAQQVLDFDVAKIKMREEGDRRMILNSVAGIADSGAKPPDSCLEYKQMNNLLNSKAAGPLLRIAAYLGDIAAVDRVMKTCPGLNLDEKGLQGVLGEKALHIAAAAGHVETARYLLLRDSDPNAADLNGETPLHVAAFAGQFGTVQLLLEFEADPLCKSYDGETPLHVAIQNPAYFLGVDTAEVAAALEDAQAHAKRRGRRMAEDAQLPAERVRLCLADEVRKELAAKRREVERLERQLEQLLPGEGRSYSKSENNSVAAAPSEGGGASPRSQRSTGASQSSRGRTAIGSSTASRLEELLSVICLPGTRRLRLAKLRQLFCSIGCEPHEVQSLLDDFSPGAGSAEGELEVDCAAFLQWLFGEGKGGRERRL